MLCKAIPRCCAEFEGKDYRYVSNLCSLQNAVLSNLIA